jgi:bifunctional non-homologous end joining protein LigD
MAYVNEGEVKLQTRNLKDYTGKFAQITSALQKWKHNAVLDGEVVMLNNRGVSDFNALQNWRSDEDGPLYYFVFDLLWLDGKDYMNEPLYRRKSALKNILPKSSVVIYQSEIMTHGVAAFKMAQGEGLEGIVAKRVDSIYKPGIRTKDWLKLKVLQEDDFIIAGYTKNLGAGLFSTLILGKYIDGSLHFEGEVGTGFSQKLMEEIVSKLKPVKKSLFAEEIKLTSRWRKKKPEVIVWCKPELICTVKFLERTSAGELLRHPSFKCLRPDKTYIAGT